MRKFEFQNEYFYHIYNRGVDKRVTFENINDYARFILSVRVLNTNKSINISDYLKTYSDNSRGSTSRFILRSNLENFSRERELVDIVCYCILPNHFHFILKQNSDNGISKFMQKLITSYTMYFNTKNNRSGALFQGKFKAKEIKTDEQLLQTSLYVNGNAEIHKIAKADKWQFSSYPDYLGLRKGEIANKNIILQDIKIEEYKSLLQEIIKDSQKRKDEIREFEK